MRAIALLLFGIALQCWAGEKPGIVFIAGEYEYSSRETLPPFAQNLTAKFEVETTVLKRPDDEHLQTIPGLDTLKEADLLVLFVRRMTLPTSELKEIRDYLAAGKPLVALRTSSHAFENWKEFDKEVLGGNYGKHHGNALKSTITLLPAARIDPLLKGVTGFVSDGSLYKNTPLQAGTQPLLMGKVDGHPPEPVAWTYTYNGARIFYTSLGHPNDFKEKSFNALLHNAINWALGQDLKEKQ